MRLFSFPENYQGGAVVYEANASFVQGAPAPELSDGRDDTSNASERYLIDFAGTDRKRINAIFTETSGFDNVSLVADTGQGGGGSVSNFVINTAAQLRGTRHYAFTPLFDMTASRVRLSFGGGPGRVWRVALCRQLLNITTPNWTQIAHRHIGEGNQRRTNIVGGSVVIESRAGRWKTQTDFTGWYPANSSPTIEQFISTVSSNPNLFAYPLPEAPPRGYPTFFYPAAIDPASIQVDYVGQLLNQRELRFTLQEL